MTYTTIWTSVIIRYGKIKPVSVIFFYSKMFILDNKREKVLLEHLLLFMQIAAVQSVASWCDTKRTIR